MALILPKLADATPPRGAIGQSIRTITIAHKVSLPKEMVFAGLSETLTTGIGAGFGGGVGAGLAATGMTRKGEAAFAIDETVRRAMAAEIQRSGKLAVKTSGPADAELQLRVIAYGFYSTGPFARRVRPLLGFVATLVDRKGAIVWKHRCAVTSLNHETPALLPEDIKRDPQIGAEALRVAAQLCARKAIATLKI